ncbi:hypothetical protein [Stenotrophomonas phage RAS14]
MRTINRAENWERAYEAYQQVNFSAWDFASIKESLIDYMKLYYPEDFNDFTENSDLIAVLELFAYISEQYAYRNDLNAHENFITIAERKESVLRLAKMLSYNASRNIPARGLVKITSIVTTERVFDSKGNDISNKTIYWNDPNNVNWKEQFTLVMNRVLEQEFGTVLPSDRVQVNDVVFELYTLKNDPLLPTLTIPFNINVSGNNYPMEVVSSRLNEFGPYEKRPEKNQSLNFLYLSDGLGDDSENTGFFYLVKQGRLDRREMKFDGVTPNQTYDVNVVNCNETDIWLNNIDPDTGMIITGTDVLAQTRIGEWERVDIANSQNVIFNTNPNRNKYEVQTIAQGNRENMFRMVFGDGKFANIPNGTFEVWFRVSANEDLVIPTTSIQNVGTTFTYRDADNKSQTFSASFSLTNPIQNSAPAETIDHIRRIAPAVYYTQDRMVNGRDYNDFPLQDNTILKLRAINRTFAGDSKYIYWHDPSEYYENVKIFGNDLVVYFDNYEQVTQIPSSSLPPDDGGANTGRINALLLNWIQPILQSEPYFIKTVLAGLPPANVRTEFTAEEMVAIRAGLLTIINNVPSTLYFRYNPTLDVWTVATTPEREGYWFYVQSNADQSFTMLFEGVRIVMHSDMTKFWVSNDNQKVITYDTFDANFDTITILQANIGTTGILSKNYAYNVMRQMNITVGSDIGTQSIHDLLVLPADDDQDGTPDDVSLSYLIDQNNPNYVYFNRVSVNDPWEFQPLTADVITAYNKDQTAGTGLWKREIGRESLNFLWMHRTPRYHLVDPAPSNIIDWFIISRSFYFNTRQWLDGILENKPTPPTPFQLRSDYSKLLESKMISDTVILHPGKFKFIIGDKADDELKATLKVIRSPNQNLTNNQIKTAIVDAVNTFFEIDKWEFGQTFYFSELAAYVHSKLPVDIESIVIVPDNINQVYGDLQQIVCREDEIIQPSISVNDIEIITSIEARNLKKIL